MIGWRTVRIEDIAEVLGGGTPPRGETHFFGGGIAWATPTDLTSLPGLYIDRTAETLSDEGLKNSSSKLLPVGAVLLTSRATIGFTAVSRVPISTNQGFVNFVCGHHILPEFLALWLRTQKQKLIQFAGGTTFKEIARGTVRKFEIALPPIDEQRRLVDILLRVDGLAQLRREAMAATDELFQSLLHRAFSGQL